MKVPAAALAMIISGTFAVTADAQQQRLEFRVGGLAQLGARNVLLLDQVSASTGSLAGGEMVVQYRGVGLKLRLQGGAISDSNGVALGDVAQGDASVLLGNPTFAIDAGYSRRAYAGPRSTALASAARAGVQVGIPIGSSGFVVRVAPGAFLPLGSQNPELKGFDLETAFLWTPSRWPAYVQIGYRHEQYLVTSESAERAEELSGVLFGAGYRFAR